MENDIEYEESFINENIFKIDYINQNLDNNTKYKKWNNLMLSKYGKNSKILRCIKDNIIFYAKYEDAISSPCYKIECPICKCLICHFCSYCDDSKDIYFICCFKKGFYGLFCYYGLRYIKKIDKNKDIQNLSDDYEILISLIPGFNFFAIYTIIVFQIFFNLSYKDKETYRDKFEKNSYKTFFYYIDISTAILLIIPLILLNIYFILFLLLISILFKLYPFKYYLGIIDSGI